jgi:hypothetical protein
LRTTQPSRNVADTCNRRRANRRAQPPSEHCKNDGHQSLGAGDLEYERDLAGGGNFIVAAR